MKYGKLIINFNLDELNLNPWHGDTVTHTSNIKDVRCKSRLHASVELLAEVWPLCCATSTSSYGARACDACSLLC